MLGRTPRKKNGEGTLKSSLAGCATQIASALLPGQPQAEFHRAASTVELVCIQECGRPCGYEGVGGAERVGIGRLINRSIVGGQTQAEVPVIKGIERFRAELHAETLADFGVLDQGEVPNIDSRRSNRITAEIGFCTEVGLDIAGPRILSDITNHKVAATRSNRRSCSNCTTRSNTSSAYSPDRWADESASTVCNANEVDAGPGEALTCRVEDGAVACTVPVSVGIGARKDRDRLTGLRDVEAGELPSVQRALGKGILHVQLGQVVDEADGQLVVDVQSGTTALIAEIVGILRTPRIDPAAEEFIGGIVDVLGKRVVGAEIQATVESVDDVNRAGMIDALSDRRESRED